VCVELFYGVDLFGYGDELYRVDFIEVGVVLVQ